MTEKLIATRTANGKRTCYHTDPTCRYITDCSTRELMPGEIEYFDLHECTACADRHRENNGGSESDFKDFRQRAHKLDL